MSSLEFEAKNVEKAVKNACDELNIPADDIDFEVLSRGSSGIFGLARAKKARIRVTLPDKTTEIPLDDDHKLPDEPVLEAQIPAETPLAEDGSSETPQPANGPEENPVDLAQAVLQRIIDAITSDASIAMEKTNDSQKEIFRPTLSFLSS